MQMTNKPLAIALLLVTSCALAQSPGKKAPSVTMAPVEPVTVTRGKGGAVSLHFRVASGFHINSNTPKSEFLIPTALKMDAPTDIVLTKLTYPQGAEMSFPFAPNEPLSVYSGDFTVSMTVR
ncbi:MAG: disulfide bond formation protein DsbC, partial [Acidobacteria bacterium]